MLCCLVSLVRTPSPARAPDPSRRVPCSTRRPPRPVAMDALASGRPHMLEVATTSVSITIRDTKWVPSTARFVTVGNHMRDTGALHVYALDGLDMKRVGEAEAPHGLRCCTFGASPGGGSLLATGSLRGELHAWDLNRLDSATWRCESAHGSGIVNAIDGVAGGRPGHGAPELATGGSDGRVCVWDPRVRNAPVMVLEPGEGCPRRDAWAVAFGDAKDADSRCLAAGYDNGDVKVYDLRTGGAVFEAGVGNGVVALEFDRREIAMNTLAVSCLESMLHVFDCRTHHPDLGWAQASVRCPAGATLWGAKHTPQNRDVFLVHAGNGGMYLYKYCYPDARRVNDKEGRPIGVAGSLELLCQSKTLTAQPVHCFDWSPDKEGLAVYGSYDQCLRIMTVTGLNTL